MNFDGHRYRLHLGAIERAYFAGVVARRYDNHEGVARATGLSRSTVSRFFHGRVTSIRTTLKLLDELGLEFEEVARPVDQQEVPSPASSGS